MEAVLEREFILSREMDSQSESSWLYVHTGSSHTPMGEGVGRSEGVCASESIVELYKNTI